MAKQTEYWGRWGAGGQLIAIERHVDGQPQVARRDRGWIRGTFLPYLIGGATDIGRITVQQAFKFLADHGIEPDEIDYEAWNLSGEGR